MLSEHEFIRQRIEIVEQALRDGPSEYVGGWRRAEFDTGVREERLYKLEASLLHHILISTHDDQILRALADWRRMFRKIFTDYHNMHQETFVRYTQWCELSSSEREYVSKPLLPPALRHIDQYGKEWLINDEFLTMLWDIYGRLKLWLADSSNNE